MKRFKHNLSYYNLLTCDMGQLIPIGLMEALPGDTFQHHTNMLIRVSPLASPIMHNITARVHHFFVPHRLVWDGWEDFITAGPDGNDSSLIPTVGIDDTSYDIFNLFDYFGIPKPATSGPKSVSALPIRGYKLIFNEYYRDQDLVPPLNITNDSVANIVQSVAWEKDYFTTARPFTQKGPDITVPLGDEAPVVRRDGQADASIAQMSSDSSGLMYADASTPVGHDLYADLSTATAANVNAWRKAFALQRYAEARARYGSRYTEYLRYLGVRPRDERLQRPEFLGGGSAQVQISEILQTAPETGQDPSTEFGVGDMYGHGIAAMRSNAYRRTMEEHGYVISMLSVRPKAIYANGIDRTWLRRNREDFFQKELQHIGQQEIYNAEVYFGGADADQTFGWQDRYAEYRQGYNRVCGEYRDILNYWHMAREFQDQPVLNKSFIDCVPTKRIHNEQTKNALWVAAQHKLVARRLVDRSAAPRIY